MEDILDELRPRLTRLQPRYTRETPAGEPANLPKPERLALKCLSADVPAHIDAIADRTEMPASDVLTALLSLELAGFAEQLPGKRFVRKLV